MHNMRRAVNRVNHLHEQLRAYRRQLRQHVKQQQQQQQQGAAGGGWLAACAPDSLLMAVEGGVLLRDGQDLYCMAWAAARRGAGGARWAV
jgi:hypothetical protein